MSLQDFDLSPQVPTKADVTDLLIGLDHADLMTLRGAIDKEIKISPHLLNMADELGFQYRAGKTLLESISNDSEVPANQRAQVFNSVGTMLDKITKQMKGVYDAERLKRFEAAFMKTLEEFPEEAKRKFFDLYGDYLKQEDA